MVSFSCTVNKGKIAIRQRMDKDIWQGLYEFPDIESGKPLTNAALLKEAGQKKWLSSSIKTATSVSPWYKQQLTHQLIHGQFIRINLTKKPELPGLIWLSEKELKQYAFPRLFREYLENLK